MKNKSKNILIALIFIALAINVFCKGMGITLLGGFFSKMLGGVSAWDVFWTIILCIAIVDSLTKTNWFMVCLWSAFLLNIYSGMFWLPYIPTGMIFGTAILLGIGLEILLPNKDGHFGIHTHKDGMHTFIEAGHGVHNNDEDDAVVEGEYVERDAEYTSCASEVENNFGSRVQYFNSNNFSYASVSSNFGSFKAYFINAKMSGTDANINVSNCFGETEVYVPRDWHVDLKSDSFMAGVDEIGSENWDGEHTVHIKVECNFGNVKIIHA